MTTLNLRTIPLSTPEEIRQALLLLQKKVETKHSLNAMMFKVIRQETQRLEDKLNENTLAIKSLEQVSMQTNARLDQLNAKVDGGFANIGRILQEISNKLD